ncbi:MAG: carbon-nitrogen hydrolase [Pseudomonadota bacterium]
MNNRDKFTVGLIQMQMSADVNANVAKACSMLEDAGDMGVNVVCLPELFRSLYFCQSENPANFDLAETLPSATSNLLSEIAAKRNMVIIGSLFEKRTIGLYHNTSLVFDANGEQIATYRKMHIPDDPQFYEKYYFTPGDLGFSACDSKYAKIGTLICWDQWYPEAARLTALQGANILFYPTAIGWQESEKAELGASQVEAWQIMQRSHAIANGVYVAACNRIGVEGNKEEGELEFWGNSFIADPLGRIIAQASSDKEEIITAVCDTSLQEEARRSWPFLRDRRIDAYGGITQRFGK